MAVFEFGLYKPDSTKPKSFTTAIRLTGFPSDNASAKESNNESDKENGEDRSTRVEVTYSEQANDDGTTTRTVECGLEEVSDGGVQNPIQNLFWNSEQQKHFVYGNITDPFLDSIAEPILVRECWCARVFGTFSYPFVPANPPGPMFCPMRQDTNGNGSPAPTGRGICTAMAVFSEDDLTILAQESNCFREDSLSDFSEGAWPLCYVWYALLACVLLGTQYGRRVRGLIWRAVHIQSTKLSERRQSRETNASGNASRNADGDGSAQIVDDIERGGIIDEASRTNDSPDDPEPTAPRGSARSETPTRVNSNIENDNEQETGNARSTLPETSPAGEDAIAQEFGSVQNYQLLDRELRYQAERTGNEYIRRLWYSALYTEVRRYRYERFQRRRERSRRQAGEDDTTGEASSDDEDDNYNDVDLMRNPSQRLDSVFWCQPASPNGERWEDVRNQGRQTHDENGNRIDGNRLRLKTKRFIVPEKKDLLIGANDNDSGDEDENDNPDCGQSTVGDEVRMCKDKNDDTPLEVAPKAATKETEPDAEVGENVCSICLGEIEEGDLVGDIPCGHVFHKDCLKAWLVKNNHCPVCRTPGIALHPLLGTPAPTTHT